jgi:hypothetical protein
MKIYYGIEGIKKIDITEILKKDLMDNHIIMIPYGDNMRAKYFTDPLPGMHKNIIIDNGTLTEYDEYGKIEINLLTNSIVYIDNSIVIPITFCFPFSKITFFLPNKEKILSDLILGDLKTYIYETENDYYQEYKKSLFAITKKKGGWDCLRHYEIIGNYCLPYFLDIEQCPKKTLYLWPKHLQIEANNLYAEIQSKKNIKDLNNKQLILWNDIMKRFLYYFVEHLTTKKMAQYILDKSGNQSVSQMSNITWI